MSDARVIIFLEWLDSELARRGWNDFQLSRKAGISHSAFSRARRGALPSWDVCGAIARALDVPAELVFRKAGLLPEREDEPVSFEHWRHILEKLSDEDRDELMEIARLKLDRQSQRRRQGGMSKTQKEPGSR